LRLRLWLRLWLRLRLRLLLRLWLRLWLRLRLRLLLRLVSCAHQLLVFAASDCSLATRDLSLAISDRSLAFLQSEHTIFEPLGRVCLVWLVCLASPRTLLGHRDLAQEARQGGHAVEGTTASAPVGRRLDAVVGGGVPPRQVGDVLPPHIVLQQQPLPQLLWSGHAEQNERIARFRDSRNSTSKSAPPKALKI